MLFSTLIIGVAFIPLFTMTGVAGVIFSPMAHTYAFAIGGAMLLALTLTPVLASGAHARRLTRHENDNCAHARAHRALHRRSSISRSSAASSGGAHRALPVGVSLRALPSVLGREFMPKLEEGNFWIRATLPTSISLEQSAKYVGRMRDHPARLPRRTRRRATDAASHAPRDHQRSSRSSGAPTTAPTSPASTTSSCSRRSARSTNGRAA